MGILLKSVEQIQFQLKSCTKDVRTCVSVSEYSTEFCVMALAISHQPAWGQFEADM